MYSPVQRIILIAAISCAGCSTVGGSATALSGNTWDDSCNGAMREIVQPLTGESVVDCGFLALDASDQDFRNVLQCAKSAVQSGKPYRFGYRNIDKYLSFCKVAAHAPDGQLWSLEFYVPIQDAMSQRKDLQYNFNASQCSSIQLKNDRRGFFDMKDCTEATDALLAALRGKSGG
jgi:hypothetical protein